MLCIKFKHTRVHFIEKAEILIDYFADKVIESSIIFHT